uniref:Uncharacterized protein n=1 Tax=Hippocampus comes TaxID=109280 RepID=A0A3Q2Z7M1_HIPCM
EAVNSKKVLFEAGEARTGGPPKTTTCRDVKCGDVMRKKNMWEVIGDSSGRSPTNGAAAPSKTYTFVVTGHGKYKKISSDQEHATNRKSGERTHSHEKPFCK